MARFSLLRDEKALYSALTAFFFLIVAVAVTLALLKVLSNEAVVEAALFQKSKEGLTFFSLRDVFTYCYGSVLEGLNDPAKRDCVKSYAGVDKGLVVEVLGVEGCHPLSVEVVKPSSNRTAQSLSMPVYEGRRICLGKLKVYR